MSQAENLYLGIFPNANSISQQKEHYNERLNVDAIQVLADRIGISTSKLLPLADIAFSSYHGWKCRKLPLSQEASLKLRHIAYIVQKTEEFAGEGREKQAIQFLLTPAPFGKDKELTWLEVSKLPGGTEFLTRHMRQMEYGLSP